MTSKIPLKEVDDFAPAEVQEIDLYQRREKIYTRKIEGFFQRVRLLTGWPLLLGYFLVPWIYWDGQPIVLFDLPERQFHILGLTLFPQDFPLLAWLLIIAAFALFFVTMIAGRVWCGYTCPQTVWTSIFMWIEQFTEGSRNQRIKLDKAPWSSQKAVKKGSKYAMWGGFSLLTGFTFIAYFYPARELIVDLFTLQANMWAVAWTVFFTLATYINAGLLREQVCMYMCPYARFQSVMFDSDTLVVSYDAARGEPRGARKRHQEKPEDKGDCIDCELCVQVCPTGIDIRHGLQYECITCALCVDACDSVMDRMGYDRGLIRYTSENALEGKEVHVMRPRLVGYGVAILLMVSLFLFTIFTRTPLELDVIRDRNQLYSINNQGLIENIYTLKIINMDNADHEFSVSVDGIEGINIKNNGTVTAKPLEVLTLPIRVEADPGLIKLPTTAIEFRVVSDSGLEAVSESRFIRPRIM